MEESKSIWLSKTFYGVLMSIAGIVAGMMHLELGEASGWVENLAALAGALFAIYGRIKAVHKIG